MRGLDCHEGQLLAEAKQTALTVDAALRDARIHWEPSTPGSGLHGYCLLSRSFDPEMLSKGAIGYLPEAAEAVHSALQSNGMIADLQTDLSCRRKVYANRGCKPSTIASLQLLTEERLSKLLACIVYELGQRSATWGKAQTQALMLKAFDLRVSDKEFKAAMRWLRRNRLVKLVDHHSTGRCRTYEIRWDSFLGQATFEREENPPIMRRPSRKNRRPRSRRTAPS